MMPQNQDQGQFTPEQGQQAQQQIIAELKQANLPTERLVEIGQWAEAVINDPSQFPAFQAWLKSQGLPEEKIPKEADYQELASMAAIGRTAAGMMEQEQAQMPAPVQSAGPVSPDQLQAMAGAGRMGDTQLAHINPQEAAVLQSMGGVGTINPATGLPEYGFFSDLWDGVKSVAKAIAPIALPVIAIFAPALIPAIGTALGASAALAPVVGAAAIAGGTTLLAGGSIKEALTAGALTGLGTYLSPILGDYVGKVTGITDATLKSVIGSATFSGGITALRGGTVGQILTAAATGAAGNYLGQIAGAAVNGVTNARVTQKSFDDAVFLAADAEQLAAQGLGKNQITEILTQTGVSGQVASTAANNAVSGISAADSAAALTNRYGTAKSLYSDGATGVTKSIVGGGSVKALENVQQAEDAIFVMKDAQNLRATGLSEQQITQTLIASGVPPKVAATASYEAIRGATLDAGAQTINYAAQQFKVPVFDDTTATRAIGGGDIVKPADPSTIEIRNIEPGQTEPSGPTTTVTNPGVAQVEVSPPVNPIPNADQVPFRPEIPAPVATPPVNTTVDSALTTTNTYDDGSTMIVDNTTGRPIGGVDSGGRPYRVDSVTGAGYYTDTGAPTRVSDTSTQRFDDGSTLVTDNQTGRPVGGVDSTGRPYAVNPITGGGYYPDNGQPTQPVVTPPPPPPLTSDQVGTIVGLPPTDTAPLNPPTARDMGTFTPAPPDPSFSMPLQYGGLNPGLIGAGIRPAYQTTSPVQAQYYYGRQPFMATPADLDRYNQSPFMPAQPFGIQQGYFEQPAPYGQLPVYGQGMQPIPPEQFPTPGQIGGNEPLPQPIPVQQPVTPYEMQPLDPMTPRFAVQPRTDAIVPQNLFQYQLSQNPYVYSVVPTASQYSVPASAPMGVA